MGTRDRLTMIDRLKSNKLQNRSTDHSELHCGPKPERRGRQRKDARIVGKYTGACPNCDLMIMDLDGKKLEGHKQQVYQCKRCECTFSETVDMKMPDVKVVKENMGVLGQV